MRTLNDTVETAIPPSKATNASDDDDNGDNDDTLPCGTRVGPWLIDRLLGTGGMGDVYGVIHRHIGKRAALKIMHRRLSLGLHADRIELEARVVNRVRHANIVDIFEAGELRGRQYLVMERLDGRTLTDHLHRQRLSWASVIEILLQLCSALAAAHAAGVIHRDLKPDNVFVLDVRAGALPQIKLLDWGIAKVLDDGARRTMEGQVMGTPAYLSPEQACGRPVTPATDVYALGVIAYQLFLAQLPFEATCATELLMKHVGTPPRSPTELWPDIPPRLEQLLLTMLAKDARDRPSMTRVIEELEAVAPQLRDVPQPRNTHRLRNVLGIAGVLAGVVALGIFASEREARVAVAAATPAPPSAGLIATPDVRTQPVAPYGVVPPAAPAIAATPTERVTMPPDSRRLPLSTRPGARRTARGTTSSPATGPTSAPQVATVKAPSIPAAIPAALPSATTDAMTVRDPSSAVVADLYVNVGRELKSCDQAIELSDLRARYRLLRIHEALLTPQTRAHAIAILSDITRQIHARTVAARRAR